MSTMTIAATPTTDTSDLVTAARSGCSRAMAELVDRYAGVVWAAVRSLRMRDADAHDAVQNTWLRMIEHLGDIRDSGRLPGWLATTARREGLKILQQGRREVVGIDERETGRTTPGPEHDVIDRTMNSLLWTQVAQLPAAGSHMLASLTDPDAPSYRDYARLNGMPVGSVGPRRMRYLQQLRTSLERSGLGSHAW
jgi:RNA polymerase sigma factor (sigma-70 family)